MPESPKLVTVPSVEIRPIESLPAFVNQSAPSRPAAIPRGVWMLACLKRVTLPVVEIRPIVLLPAFVNQSAPSRPAVILRGCDNGATKLVIETFGPATAI